MIALLSYFVKMLFCSGVLYAYYALALKNNPIHRWNRGYIILATIASLTLPFLQFSANAAPAVVYSTPFITVYGYVMNNTSQAATNNSATWIPTGLYSLIVLILLFNMLRNWILIKRLVKQGERTSFRDYYMIKHPQVKSTFSFFNHVFWGEETTPESPEGRQVLRHELEHVNAGHTSDKLFMQLVCSIFWINPFFYLLRRELAMVHEFLADKAAASGEAPDDYARTLLQMTLQTKRMLLANSFAQAPVKRRILMLFTDTSRYITLKKAIIIPVALLLAFVIGCQRDLELKKPDLDKAAAAVGLKKNPEVYTIVSDPPTFPGGEKALAKFLSKNIHYPKTAQDLNKKGTVFVNFIVESDGSVRNVKTVGAFIGGGLEEESKRVITEMPKWHPGKQDGKEVAVEFNLPIRFVLQD